MGLRGETGVDPPQEQSFNEEPDPQPAADRDQAAGGWEHPPALLQQAAWGFDDGEGWEEDPSSTQYGLQPQLSFLCFLS